jgi:CheY-like chemotaxis protein
MAPPDPNTSLPDLRSIGVHQPVILVADDEAMNLNLVTILMQRAGYVVLSACDGQEGLEISRTYPGKIDLVISDMEMPRINGTDLCARLLRERPGIKAIVMSGADLKKIIGQDSPLPFLPKPFNGETLRAKVQAVLASPLRPTD